MRAFLLAAGLGERLRPLTLTKPKALAPVANRPAIVRLLELLQPYGIHEMYINLHGFREEVKDVLGAGSQWGARIHYSYEPELLGTAGAIAKVKKFLAEDRLLIVNTDIVTDIDISKALEYHEKKGARATLIVSEQDDIDYQQIGVSSDGRILIDKTPGDLITNGVYTGIAICEPSVVEMIPQGYSSLLESVFIPLATEGTLYAFFAKGYWMDIGKIERYMRANKDAISGKINIPIDGRLIGDNLWIDESSEIDFTVTIEEPALIGKRVSVERGAIIGPYAIIGDGCTIRPGAEVRNSILWGDCKIGAHAKVHNSIISDAQNIARGQRATRIILHHEVAEPIFNI